MKLKEENNKVEQGGGTIVVEHEMEIKKENQHVILGIVSHKMYSNPIRTIIQEVGCNARDAHREYGNPQRPIKIKLPDYNDPSFYIQDFGVGVDPDRMANVFVNYGASTKRDSDDETGGFGLGAKSPFSYTDQFGIVSVTPDENGVMILRQYMAIYEGKRRVVKLVEERLARAEEERGTKIIIPVKPEDFDKFREWTIDRCRYWSPHPEVYSKGYNITWPTDEVDIEGKDGTWQIMKLSGLSYDDRKPKAVVDGVPYPIDRSSVERASNTNDRELNELWQFPVLLHFKTGEVSMTATREELDYTNDVTGKVIRDKFKEIIEELKKNLSDKVASCKTYIEANCEWNKIKTGYNSIISSVKWNGHAITGNGFNETSVTKIRHFKPDSSKTQGVRANNTSRIYFEENMKVVIDMSDTKGVQTSKIARLFDDDSTLRHVYVIKLNQPDKVYNGHAIFKDKKDFDTKGTIHDIYDWLKDNTNLGLYESVNIDKLEKRKPKKRQKSDGTKVVRDNAKVIRKYYYDTWRTPSWLYTDLDYKTDKGVLVYLKNREAYLNDDFTNAIGNYSLKELCESFGITLYGVLSAHTTKVGSGWTPLKDYINAEFKKCKKEIESLTVPKSFSVYSDSNIMKNINSLVLPKDSELAKMVDDWKKCDKCDKDIVNYRKKAMHYNRLCEAMKIVDHKNKDNYKLIDFASTKDSINYEQKIKQRYPFLTEIGSWYCKVDKQAKIDYIKAMDAYLGPVV